MYLFSLWKTLFLIIIFPLSPTDVKGHSTYISVVAGILLFLIIIVIVSIVVAMSILKAKKKDKDDNMSAYENPGCELPERLNSPVRFV